MVQLLYRTLEHDLEERLIHDTSELQRLAADSRILALMQNPGDATRQAALERLRYAFLHVDGVAGDRTPLFLLDVEGNVLASVDSASPAARFELPQADAAGLVISMVQGADGEFVLQEVLPVRSAPGQPIVGYVGGEVPQATLQTMVDVVVLYPDLQQAYLVDADGQFGTQPHLATSDLVGTLIPALDTLDKTGAEPSRYRNYSGREVIGMSAAAPEVGWMLVVEQDIQKTLAPVRALIGVIALILVGGSAVAGFISWRVSILIEKPIRSGLLSMDEAVQRLTTSASEQAAGSQEQASSVGEVTATMDELSRTADQIASNSEETLNHAELGKEAFHESQAGMVAVTQRVEATARQILALGEKSQRIGEISRIITGIADRIHLLALNAAIEAAGAGEYGRRFAVVASQVKELADATRESSAQVQQLIDEIRNATNSAIMVTEQATKQVEATAQVTERAGTAVEEIVQRVEAVVLATQQQHTASEQVVAAMREIAEVSRQSAQVSGELAESAEHLSQAMEPLYRLIKRPGT